MFTKRVLALLVVIALLFVSASCADRDASGDTAPPLRIYMMDYDMFLEYAVNSYNSGGGSPAVEAKTFFSDQSEQYINQLKSELAAGGGPDLIVLPTYLVPDISRYIRSGYFYDLSELIAKDKEFKPDDYMETVMDSGLVNGGRFFLPVSYSIEAMFTTRSTLELYGLNPDEPLISLDSVIDMADAFRSRNPAGGKYMMDQFTIFHPGIDGLVDIHYKDAVLDSAEISYMLDVYKGLNDVLFPLDKPVERMGNEASKRLRDGETDFLNCPIYSFRVLAEPYGAFGSGVVPEICSISLSKEGSVAASPFTVAAINANCKDKESAFRFLKHLLSKETQSYEYMNGLPVNKAAYEAQKEAFLNGNAVNILGSGVAEKITQELDSLLEGSITCGLIDSETGYILQEEFTACIGGEKAAGEAVAAMQQRLSENRDKKIEAAVLPSSTPAYTGEKIVLTIQFMDFNWAVKNAIRSFGETRPDVEIEQEVFSSDAYEEYVTKLTTSIMAGEGPDIIYYRPNIFNSFHKAAATGAFCDLNELIAADDTFGSLDLNEAVLESGVYNGKRYFLPLRYRIPFAVTTRSILDRHGIIIDDGWTLEDLRNIVLDFASKSGNKYFFSPGMSFKLLLDFCGRSFIDLDAGKSNFRSQEFIDLMKLYKDISPYIMPNDQAPDSALPAEMQSQGKFVMCVEYLLSPESVYMYNAIYNGFDEEAVFYPFPTIKGAEGKPIDTINAVSINSLCKDKQAAMDFIEELLSVNIQTATDKYGNNNITNGFPVNREAMRKDFETFIKPENAQGVISTGTRTFTPIPMPEALASRVIGINDQTIGSPVTDNAVSAIINNWVYSYINGKVSAEEAAKNIEEKVNLFLSE